jgi:hypothetical protein
MIRWIVLLMSATAVAAPNQLGPRNAHRFGDGLVRIEKPGDGEPPDDADEVTYRYDVFKDRDPAQATHEVTTRRMTDQTDRIRDNLLVMKPGEIRWLWFAEQDGMLCDHFGCAHGPDNYAAKLELVSVTRHADELPDAMHITAFPYFGVRRGKTSAALPGEQVKSIASVRVVGDSVVIEDDETRFEANAVRRVTHTFGLAELRARLLDEEGLVALHARSRKTARDAFENAVALAPELDVPQLHLAAAHAALHEAFDLSVMKRDPAGLYWRVMEDPLYVALRKDPAVTALVSTTKGTLDAMDYRCEASCMSVDPSGRYLVAWASIATNAEFNLSFGALRVIDLSTGAVLETIPLDDGSSRSATDGTYRCEKCARRTAAERMLVDLGFRPITSAAKTIEYRDTRHTTHPLITFTGMGVQLGLASDKPADAKQYLAIDPPPESKLVAVELFDHVVIYRWSLSSVSDVAVVRR